MSFRLKRKESIAEGVRRIAREQADKAMAAAGGAPTDEDVHDARVCCKKLRSLLRLVRPAIGELYRQENVFLRDAAQSLSDQRDVSIAGATFEELVRQDKLDAAATDAVRAVLSGMPAGREGRRERLAAFGSLMRSFRERIEGWAVRSDGPDAFADGLTSTYRRGRKAMRAVLDAGDDASRHEWRKQAKYHGYHARLLRSTWKPVMKVRERELEHLSDLLGRDHDLAVLRGIIRAADLDPEYSGTITTLIDRRRAKLLAKARPLGERLYAEKPKVLTKGLRCHWKVWRAGPGAIG